jgi:hypothetical protein
MDANNMSPAVRAALERRNAGSPTPALQQITPNAQAVNSPVAPNPIPQSAMTKSSAMPTTPKAPSQKYQPTDQASMIAMALTEQLKSLTSLEKEKLKVAQGQSIQPPTPQVPSFNQASPQNAGSGIFGAPASMSTSQMQGGNPLSAGPF